MSRDASRPTFSESAVLRPQSSESYPDAEIHFTGHAALYHFVTFDCYGTLIDWERGIGDAFVRAAAREGRALEPRSVLAAYAAIEPEIEAGPYRSYRDTLRLTASRVAGRCGWLLSEEDAGFLPESLPSWAPFRTRIPRSRSSRRQE